MYLEALASKIPADYRAMILESNAIFKAVAIPSDPHMKILFTVWHTFVDSNPDLDLECTICLARILNDYKTLQETLVNLHREAQLLDDL